MKNKVVGLLLCAGLVIAALFLQWREERGGFYHQHKEEAEVSVSEQEELENGNWNVRSVSSRDFLLRNYVFCNLLGDLTGKAPVTKYTQTADGSVVQLGETMPHALESDAEYMICLAPENDSEVRGTELNTLAIYRHLVKSGRNIRLVVPAEASEQKAKDIRGELSYFEKTLYSYDFDSDDYGYDRFIDVESFIRFLLVTELAAPDEPEKIRFYLYKNKDGKYAICTDSFVDSAGDPGNEFCLSSALWYTMLLKDSDFVDGVVNEYHDLRRDKLSEEKLTAYIRQASDFLDCYYGSGSKAEAEELETYLKVRLAWMDANIESLYQYSAKSSIKNYTDDPY